MWTKRGARQRRTGQKGQSVLETAIMMPLLLTVAFNAINWGYFWFLVLTLSAIPRQGVQYASQGGSALASTSAPSTTEVKEFVYENLTGSLRATEENASVRVCSVSKGIDTSTQVALCDTFGPSASYSTMVADLEEPVFVLNRVDVAYRVTPIIPGGIFNVVLPSDLTFHRQVSMRSLY